MTLHLVHIGKTGGTALKHALRRSGVAVWGGDGPPHETPWGPVQLQLRVKRLLLSTEDTAQTEGHAQLRFTATQDGRPLWSFVARTDQGAEPELSGPPEVRTATVRRESGRLVIENLTMPIAYEAPGASGSTRVEVVLSYEGEDARI